MSILRIEVKVDGKLIEAHEFNAYGPTSLMHFWEFIGIFQKKMAGRWSYKYFFPNDCK